MSVYAERLPRCPCGAPAAYGIQLSGTDRRGVACARHVNREIKGLAGRLGEDAVLLDGPR